MNLTDDRYEDLFLPPPGSRKVTMIGQGYFRGMEQEGYLVSAQNGSVRVLLRVEGAGDDIYIAREFLIRDGSPRDKTQKWYLKIADLPEDLLQQNRRSKKRQERRARRQGKGKPKPTFPVLVIVHTGDDVTRHSFDTPALARKYLRSIGRSVREAEKVTDGLENDAQIWTLGRLES